MTNTLWRRLISFLLCLIAGQSVLIADELRLIRYTDLWASSPARIADAAGITYLPELKRLLISDSEISEYGQLKDPKTGEKIFKGRNIFECSLDAMTLHRSYQALPTDPRKSEPVGIAWNPLDRHVYVVDDNEKRILRYRFNDRSRFGSPVATTLTSRNGAYTDPEGIAVDPTTGDLLIVSGTKNERVLRYHFHVERDEFEFISEFSVAEHISDPEGIAIHPVDRHIFAVSSGGIAEFTARGRFVHFFEFRLPKTMNVVLRLPGGATFAPSSDTDDSNDELSLYVTCRGVDNGQFPEQNSLDGGLAEFELLRTPKPKRD
ncbi:MAG TPA: hypothetical protein DDW52_16915 [Planctomycetaceae bacterium]|nr:hypothetical protein [Planctomycetaceae bacterium]